MYKEEMYTHERECTAGGREVHTQMVSVQEVHSQKGMYKRGEKYIYERECTKTKTYIYERECTEG